MHRRRSSDAILRVVSHLDVNGRWTAALQTVLDHLLYQEALGRLTVCSEGMKLALVWPWVS